MEWLIFSRRRILLFVAIFMFLGVLYFLLVRIHFTEPVDPQQLFQESVTRTKAAKSYSYSIQTRLVTRLGTRSLSDLTGSRVLPDKVCARGKLFNSPVEIIQIQGTTYIKDRYSGKWLTLSGDRLGETGVFTAELDPLVLLDFKEAPVVTRGKGERKESRDLVVLECKPEVKNRFLSSQFTDFSYRIYVDPGQQYITRVEVEGRSKQSPTKLLVDLGLGDFEKPLKIEPPANLFQY